MKQTLKWAGFFYMVLMISSRIWFPDYEGDFILDSKEILRPELAQPIDSTMLHPRDTTKFKTEWIEVDK